MSAPQSVKAEKSQKRGGKALAAKRSDSLELTHIRAKDLIVPTWVKNTSIQAENVAENSQAPDFAIFYYS